MTPLGVRLQQAGLSFIQARATHGRDGSVQVDEVVVATQDDLSAVVTWLHAEGYGGQGVVRVATEAELAEAQEWM